MRARERRGNATVVAGEQCLQLRGAFREPTQARDALAFLDERVAFAVPGVEGAEFRRVMPQQVEAGFAVLQALFERGTLLIERAPFFVGGAHGGHVRFELAAAVDGGALVAAPRQRLEFELPVHVDEQFAERAQRLHRDDLAVEVGATAAVRADDAAQLAFAFVLDRLLREPRERGAIARHGKGRAHFGAFGAVTHGPAVRAPAHGEQQRIDEDRLARAGLAGERGEAAGELQFDGLDDREVADLQVGQHGGAQAPGGWPSRVPRPQCSLERRIR